MKAVEVKDLFWRYPAFVGEMNPWVLKGLNLEVERGEFFGITGPSGAGKTTLCYFLAGILPHETKLPGGTMADYVKGEVDVLGEVVTKLDGGRLVGKGVLAPRVGLIMQDPENQFLRMSVLHEVAFGLQMMQLPPEEIEKRAREGLEAAGLGYLWPVAELLHPLELSGGQKQRVAIAAFLAMRPDLLILDEPTSDLDPVGKREVVETVRSLKDNYDLTVILVEHMPEAMLEFADRVALLDDGRIVEVERPRKFYSGVKLAMEKGVRLPELARVADAANIHPIPLTVEEGLKVLVPRVSTATTPAAPKRDSPVIITTEDVWFHYPDGTLALRGVSMDVREGDYMALLGRNGSGKTTLAKIFNGIYAPEKGEAEILGQDATRKEVRRQLARKVGYVFQNPTHQLFTRKVYEEIAYALRNLELDREEIDRRVHSVLRAVNLEDKIDEDPMFLGKGQQQRLAVACVLAMQPSVLIVDEPTTGQDYRMTESIMSLIDELHQAGTTILIITHDMTVVAEHCQQATVLHEGQIIFAGSVRELFLNEEILGRAFLEPPQSAKLSIAARRQQPDFPMLLNFREWASALKSGYPGAGGWHDASREGERGRKNTDR